MSKWKPVSLAIDIIIVSFIVIGILTSHGEVEAGYISLWDMLLALVWVCLFSSAVINLYKHFKGVEL